MLIITTLPKRKLRFHFNIVFHASLYDLDSP